jgi:probable HAF family extracellular repeat protein
VNDRGQIAGFSSNSTPDPNSLFGLGTQTRAFLWEDGAMRDLGTLGGTDAAALLVNDDGQIAGFSYTSALAIDPFVWTSGSMTDLGSLGGTSGAPQWLNSRGQVVGESNLIGDQTFHPFLWQHGALTDLGTLGGSDGKAEWISDAGVIVGWANNQDDQALLAVLWKNGVITSLGTLDSDPCSIAWAINIKGTVVGSSSADCDFSGTSSDEHAFLSEDGKMIDLNALVPSGSKLTLVEPHYINDSGEITGNAVLPNGRLRAFLLIPCDENHPGIEGCDYSLVDSATAADARPGHNAQVPNPAPGRTSRQGRERNRFLSQLP